MFQLSAFPAVGFSGSRSPSPASVAAVSVALGRVAPGAVVMVGCARGVDALVRAGWAGSSRVFEAAGFGSGRGALAARSSACVAAVSRAGGCWVSFPAGPCPAGLSPSPRSSACFCGSGSGSWASLALAAGLGLPCLVFLPPGVPAPLGWGLSPLGSGGWLLRPAPAQLALF